jgi:hypothetical protein
MLAFNVWLFDIIYTDFDCKAGSSNACRIVSWKKIQVMTWSIFGGVKVSRRSRSRWPGNLHALLDLASLIKVSIDGVEKPYIEANIRWRFDPLENATHCPNPSCVLPWYDDSVPQWWRIGFRARSTRHTLRCHHIYNRGNPRMGSSTPVNIEAFGYRDMPPQIISHKRVSLEGGGGRPRMYDSDSVSYIGMKNRVRESVA